MSFATRKSRDACRLKDLSNDATDSTAICFPFTYLDYAQMRHPACSLRSARATPTVNSHPSRAQQTFVAVEAHLECPMRDLAVTYMTRSN
jgi:hypothetical protein